jgi:hypothetical protein
VVAPRDLAPIIYSSSLTESVWALATLPYAGKDVNAKIRIILRREGPKIAARTKIMITDGNDLITSNIRITI